MPHKTYQSLSLETLYEILALSVRDMLEAADKKNGQSAYLALKEQVEVLLDLIDKKRVAAKN